jgi:hypothetical protein
MAVTVEKAIEIRGAGEPLLLPVASGETIYKGTLAAVGATGYLHNLTSTYARNARMVVIVADGSANATGPAATTANGSISGDFEEGSKVAGDKTVRYCYTKALVKLTFTSISQADVGKNVWATDNYTVDETQSGAVKIGTLVTYISATSGWVELNTFYQADGAVFYKGALTAATSTAPGGVVSWRNTTGEAIVVEHFYLDITTASAGAANVDIGVTTTSTGTSDSLIDGQACSVVKIVSNLVNGGTNGGVRKIAANHYINGATTATLASLVGTYNIIYRIAE